MGEEKPSFEWGRKETDPEQEAYRLRRDLMEAARRGDRTTELRALIELGVRKVMNSKDVDEGRLLLERARTILESLDDPASLGACLGFLLDAREQLGEEVDREGGLRRVVELLEKGNDHSLAGRYCCELGRVVSDPAEADRLFARAVVHFEETDSVLGAPHAMHLRGINALRRGDHDRARDCLEEALRKIRELRHNRRARWIEAEILEARGDLRKAEGKAEAAAEEWSESLRLWEFLEAAKRADRVRSKL